MIILKQEVQRHVDSDFNTPHNQWVGEKFVKTVVPSTIPKVCNSYRKRSIWATFNCSLPHFIIILQKGQCTVGASMLPSNIVIDFLVIFFHITEKVI